MDQTAVNEYLTRIRQAKRAELPVCPLVTDQFLPLDPQLVGIAHLMLRPRMVLGDPTGCGKTPQTLVAYGHLKTKAPTLKLLVCTTKAAQFQWVKAVDRFLTGIRGEVLGYRRSSRTKWVQLTPLDRVKQWITLADVDVLVTTYALMAKEQVGLLETFKASPFIFVFDEAHTLRSHKGAVLYPAAARIRDAARGAWGLTATPLMNDRIEELYALMELIRPGTFGPFPAFRKEYFNLLLIKPKWKGPGGKTARPFYKVLGVKNIPQLQQVLQPFLLQRPITDFDGHLPQIVFQQHDVELGPAQRRLYAQIKAKHFPGKAANAQPLEQLAALTYCQLAVDAPITLGPECADVPNAKLDVLLDLLTTSLRDQKVIVYTKYAKVLAVLSAELTAAGIKHGAIAGWVSATARETARVTFQEDPDARVILITNAGAQSLDLQAARVVLCYDLPWSHGEFQQVVGRARRYGSQSPSVVCLLLTATNTIDDTVTETVTRKETFIRTVTTDAFADTEPSLEDRENLTDSVPLPSRSALATLFTAVHAE